MKLLRLKTLRPGTRVVENEVLPAGRYHAVGSMDAVSALCGATIIETFEQGFTESAGEKCDECEALVTGA